MIGWCWYLGTLVPVIGLVKVGSQFVADRYTYIPLVGIFVAVVWGVTLFTRDRAHRRLMLGAAGTAVLAVCSALSWLQVGSWRDSISLYSHAIQVNPDNWMAHNNLGTLLSLAGRSDEAVAHFREALRAKPDYDISFYNYANNLLAQGRFNEAVAHFRAVLAINAAQPAAHNNLGIALQKLGRTAEARQHYAEALRLDPGFSQAHVNLGILLSEAGQWEEAAAQLREAVRLNPADGFARYYLNRAEQGQRRAGGSR